LTLDACIVDQDVEPSSRLQKRAAPNSDIERAARFRSPLRFPPVP